jgi:glycerol-3-phosphate O-acyltransferase
MVWLHKLLLALVAIPVRWLVKAHSIPLNIEKELGIDKSKPIIYLLRTHSVTDQLALSMSTDALGLPSPMGSFYYADNKHKACLFLKQPQSVLSRRVKATNISDSFTRLFELHKADTQLDLQIVPVSIFWGRAPGKSSSGWAELLADRASPSWLRKFFIVLFLGRDNFVCYSKAVSSRAAMETLKGDDNQIAHKLIRLARSHFYRRQQVMTGPTLLERQELYNAVLGSSAVKRSIVDEARSKKLSPAKAKVRARKYIDEIAADYRVGLVRIGSKLLNKVWNKIYNGIEVHHAKRVRELAQSGHEIIYVPCHRSHMDYLLLTYVIYHQGLVTPHIAAGINLNFWPVGGIFRRGGAFFLRRSFAGNKLYTAVFREYLELLFNKGYSVKYYPEGGRSRTGRLLPPKTGMLAMTLQAMVKGINRPVSIVPVYIGYEHVMEVASYLKELKGSSKEKESFFQVFSALRKLKNYGYGFLNFGKPILLSRFLDEQVANWREETDADPEKKPSWLTPTVNVLANSVMLRINEAAAISGMSLCATCLLSAEKHAMAEVELVQTIDDFLALLSLAPYSTEATLPSIGGEKLLRNTLKLNKLTVSEDHFGRIISLTQYNAVALTYYRNNVLHMFALPGLIAAIVIAHQTVEKEQILELVSKLYPLLQKELFIYMSTEQALLYTEQLITSMLELGLLQIAGKKLLAADPSSHKFYTLWLLNRSIQETLQRYALVLTLLARESSLSRNTLEKTSRQLAERMATLHGISAPEFYDKNVLATFINALKESKLLESTEDGSLKNSVKSQALREDIVALIAPEIAQRLQQI